jgi:4-diphosphocytidyl-2-C-methyl-D-erythritol kinase
MGGGSSDASAALRLANCGWGINWSNDQLAELAAEIGSDVPFFLSHGAAVCRGRGERVEKLAARPRLHFVVVKPPVGLNTADVYRAYDRMVETSAESPPRKLGPLDLGSDAFGWRDAGRWMHNRLQAAAASLSPWVKRIQQIFAEFDFAAHQLTGSGSAYFGVCRHAQHARRLANILRARQLGLVYTTCSCQ